MTPTRLKEIEKNCEDWLHDEGKYVPELIAEIKRLREVLAWYANIENYKDRSPVDYYNNMAVQGDWYTKVDRIDVYIYDLGQRARDAIGGV